MYFYVYFYFYFYFYFYSTCSAVPPRWQCFGNRKAYVFELAHEHIIRTKSEHLKHDLNMENAHTYNMYIYKEQFVRMCICMYIIYAHVMTTYEYVKLF